MKTIIAAFFALIFFCPGNLPANGLQKLDSLIIPGYQKFEYTYDEAGNLAAEISCRHDQTSGNWVPVAKSAYVCDTRGNRFSAVLSRWDADDRAWKAASKEDYTYDVRGNNTAMIYSEWNGYAQEWEAISKTDIEYDSAGHTTIKVFLHWDFTNSQWENTVKYSYGYDIRGDTIRETSLSWHPIMGDWVTDYQYQYEHIYDSTGNRIGWVHYIRNNREGLWENYRKVDCDFDSTRHKTMETIYSWDYFLNGWEGDIKTEFVYNAAGYRERAFFFNRGAAGSPLEIYRKEEYVYDCNGNGIEQVNYFWMNDPGTWIKSIKIEHRYNNSFCHSDLMLPPAFPFGSCVNMLTDISTYSWDLENKTWSPEGEYHLHYSACHSSAVSAADMPHLLIYPNPAPDCLHIDFSGLTAEGDIELRDPLGRLVLREKLTRGTLSIRQLPDGVYFYTLWSNGMRYGGKLCKGK